MNRIKNIKGETIVETLVAILIVSLCFLMLQSSVVTASKINASTSNNNAPFKDTKIKEDSCYIMINNQYIDVNSNHGGYYNCYKTDEGYYYYEHN